MNAHTACCTISYRRSRYDGHFGDDSIEVMGRSQDVRYDMLDGPNITVYVEDDDTSGIAVT